ncbi:DUF488 domain-containing protein [Cyclobacterium plantarum]|uniref:DUF488 domain-containing protein n=1 Tax=Cyclobacterium plantarum TaxID=2716263 RepID=UPI001C9E6FF4|nr:DUF488 family protein [Cyclobacterium plantarum]
MLLGILEEFGGALSHTKLQKILLLVTRKQHEKSFDFVPFKYGSFSFQANQDLSTLSKKEIIINKTKARGSDWIINSEEPFFTTLKKEDKAAIKQTKEEIAHLNQKELVKYTYIKYPYFAIKSQIVDDLLTDKEREQVHAQKRSFDDPAFFTIGYEGISLETYLNKLIINDVKLLCDVRKNPLSMKYGFSKKQLKGACESVGIEYQHIPQLGIDSEKRADLKTMNDYNKLFDDYERTTLVENSVQLDELFKLAEKYRRIAITCFEKEPCMCHRSRVADALKKLPTWDIDQKNL